MVPNSYDLEKVSETIYFVSYILYSAFKRLLLVDTTNKKVYGKFRILVPGLSNIPVDKAKGEDEIFLVTLLVKKKPTLN